MRINRKGPTKLCGGCGRFEIIDKDGEFYPHKKNYHTDEWCISGTPGHLYGLTDDSLTIFNKLYEGNDVDVIAGGNVFSIKPSIQGGWQIFPIYFNGRKKKSPILTWAQVANWVQGLELAKE